MSAPRQRAGWQPSRRLSNWVIGICLVGIVVTALVGWKHRGTSAPVALQPVAVAPLAADIRPRPSVCEPVARSLKVLSAHSGASMMQLADVAASEARRLEAVPSSALSMDEFLMLTNTSTLMTVLEMETAPYLTAQDVDDSKVAAVHQFGTLLGRFAALCHEVLPSSFYVGQ